MKRCFTLVELLIVVAILAILVAMLMPALSAAKVKAKKLVCVNNLRESVAATFVHAGANNRHVPTGERVASISYPHLYYGQAQGFSIEDQLKNEIDDWRVWRCGLRNAPPIDDPDNTRNWRYSTLSYFPGDDPDFGYATGFTPTSLSKVSDHSGQPILQDTVYWQTTGVWRYQHDDNGSLFEGTVDNPSHHYLSGGLPVDASIAFFDGHVRIFPFDELQDVGSVGNGSPNKVYSVLPSSN